MNKIKYESYLNENTHLHITDGNMKIGKGIYSVNTLCGDKPLRKKDGTQLTNISGTCSGCCNSCKNNCYGIKNQIFRNKNMPSWNDNTILAKERPEILFNELQSFIDLNIVAAIRYHSFGEIPSEDYLDRMIHIASKNEMVRFYTYTKRFDWIENRVNDIPSNLTINMSIWNHNYDNPYSLPEFIFDDGTDITLKNIIHCPAVDKNGNETGITCATCKKCLVAKKGDKIAVYKH